MSFGSRLRDKRKELGITQPALAERLGVSQSAIGSWETDVNSPRATLLYDLFDILHCDANYLFQDETKQLYKNEASPEEFENIIKKYRELDAHGKDMVTTVLQKEYDHIIELRDSVSQTEESSEESNNITTIDLLAAHARTDLEQTPEGVQHDLDIMNDDSKWEE